MATKSIYNDIYIRDKKLGRNLVNALENAGKKKAKEVVASKKHQDIAGEKIKEIFGIK